MGTFSGHESMKMADEIKMFQCPKSYFEILGSETGLTF